MTSRHSIVLGLVVGCHAAPRPAPEAQETCLGAARYQVEHRRDAGHLRIEAIAEPNVCDPRRDTTTLLADIPLPTAPTACPVGEPVLRHVRDRETTSLHPFVATLDARAGEDARQRLAAFVREGRNVQADAVVAGCAPLRWVVVDSGALAAMPRAQTWTYEPAATVAAAPPVDAPVCAVPPLASGAVRWIGRTLATGTMPGPSTLETFVLDRAGERVQLARFTQRAARPPGQPTEVPPAGWTCAESSAMSGTLATGARGALVLALVDPRDPTAPVEMRCGTRRVAVAAPTTLRVPRPQVDESCKRSSWARPGTRREILVCVAGTSSPLLLARDPGIEHVTIDEDDCGDPTAALRAIAPDGAVRAARRYR